MRFLNTILNIVFPPKCILCGKYGIDLCRECLKDIPAAERECAEWIFPLYDYRNPTIKKSLSLFKYKGKKRLAYIFAINIYDKITEELSELSIMENFVEPILIPIPLSPKRYRERGYNQAELICKELVKTDSVRDENKFNLENNVLFKIKDTEHQAHIKDRRIRLKNLTNTYGIKNRELIKGRNIILIDDIITTGATLNEARKILKQNGARKVIAFTVAH